MPSIMFVNALKNTYLYGYTIAVSCTEGYEIQASNTSTYQETAQWSEPFPVCDSMRYVL